MRYAMIVNEMLDVLRKKNISASDIKSKVEELIKGEKDRDEVLASKKKTLLSCSNCLNQNKKVCENCPQKYKNELEKYSKRKDKHN